MNKNNKRPQVIFLDAVGTLFGVQGSVGEVYASIACKYGVSVSPDVLNRAFFKSFKVAQPACFPGVSAADLPQQEYRWWHAVARQTFYRANVLHYFSDFDDFFANLYAHFATAAPWFVYPDVYKTLESWHHQGIELGILSNFDSRIYAVLKALNLADFFKSVTISTEVGAAKPDAKIFAVALQKHGCAPGDALHIGDSFEEDYQGALAAGLQGFWLQRNKNSNDSSLDGIFL